MSMLQNCLWIKIEDILWSINSLLELQNSIEGPKPPNISIERKKTLY